MMAALLRDAKESCEAVLRQDPTMPQAIALHDRITRLLEGDPAQREQPSIPTEEEILALDRIILQIEEGMERLAPRVLASAPGQYPYEVRDLKSPFDISEHNKENPQKNGLRIMRESRTGGQKSYRSAPGQFAYALLREDEVHVPGRTIGASYSPDSNFISLPRDFDPRCPLKLFDLYHEDLHVVQHANLRLKIGNEAYNSLYRQGGATPIIFPFEVEASGLHMEAIDRYLVGWLRQNVHLPVTPERESEFLRRMEAPEVFRPQAQSLLQGAQRFFPRGYRYPLNQEFIDGIYHAYSDRPLYAFAADGRSVVRI